MRALGSACLIAVAACSIWASSAAAVSTPRDVYVIDVGRQLYPGGEVAPGQIVQVDPVTKVERQIIPTGPGVGPLVDPTGITVDAQGFLIVADQGGYQPNDIYSPCPNGCGAVLRVDPTTGATQILSQGSPSAASRPLWTNPSSALLPPDGDLFDDGGGVEDRLLVTDPGNQNIIAVDPSQPASNNQTYFYSNYPHVDTNVNPNPPYDGLRSPWDLAREPVSGDILVTNLASNPVALKGIAGCEDSPGAGEQDGYVARLNSLGAITGYICDPDFRAPRGIVIGDNAAHTALITDPIAQNVSSAGTEYGALYRLAGGVAQLLSGGDQFATPSGLAFTYSGSQLLVADESAYPGATPCNLNGGACGGLVAVNAFYGDQGQFSPTVGGQTVLHDPIDVAVDRRGACKTLSPKKLKPPECKKPHPDPPCQNKPGNKKCEKKPDVALLRNFSSRMNLGRVRYPTTQDPTIGLAYLPMRGFDDRVKVELQCVSDCPGGNKRQKAGGDGVNFVYYNGSGPVPPEAFTDLLHGTFNVVAFRKSKRNAKLVYKSRYKTYRFNPGDEDLSLIGQGCLVPEATKIIAKPKRQKTTTPCKESIG